MTMTHKEALREAAGRYWESPIRERKLEDMEAAIRAYIEARGLVLVPSEATPEMRKAGESWSGLPGQTWDDMLASALDPFEEGE